MTTIIKAHDGLYVEMLHPYISQNQTHFRITVWSFKTSFVFFLVFPIAIKSSFPSKSLPSIKGWNKNEYR